MDQRLEELINNLSSNKDEEVNKLSEDEVRELQKKVNPYGHVYMGGPDSWVTLAITNMREEYMRKLLTTSLIGYLYRLLDEWNPNDDDADDEIFNAIRQYKMKSEASTAEDKKSASAVPAPTAPTEPLDATDAKAIVRRFLNRTFQFNPDKHVKVAATKNPADPDREDHESAAFKNMQVAKAADDVRAKLVEQKDSVNKALSTYTLMLYQKANLLKESTTKINNFVNELFAGAAIPEQIQDSLAIINKSLNTVSKIHSELKQFAEPIAANEVSAVYEIKPSIDTFYNFNRYFENNYESLRDAVNHLYGVKPDLEFAIQYYTTSTSDEDARKFRIVNQDLFIAPVFDVKNHGWTLLGPFKENRNRVDYYNKETEVVKMLFDQMESDHKAAKEMLEKRITRAKAKNIKEAGPDDPKIREYSRINNTIDRLGAKQMLSAEEKDELAAALREKEMEEVPDNAIQMDVFRTDENGKMVKDIMYTQSEAPKTMEEQSDAIMQESMRRVLEAQKKMGNASAHADSSDNV